MFKQLNKIFAFVLLSLMVFVYACDQMGGQQGKGQSKTLKNTKSKGFVRCGVSQGLPGFSNADASGNWTGVDVDVCRAVAAAVLGDANKVKYTPLSAKERFTALTSGEIDVLSRNTTWTLSRDADIGLTFVGVNFYDGQGFMVRKDSGMTSVNDFADGISACTNIGTTTELNMRDFFNSKGISYEPVAFEKADEVVAAYDSGRCDTYTTDKSGLAAQRTKMSNPDEHMVLPETISKEPLGPVVRQGDDQWADIVAWVLRAMMAGEEKGITSKNVKKLAGQDNKDKEINRLLGKDPLQGLSKLGLSADWAVNVISQVGNYAESFERNLYPLTIVRGMNALYKDGGLHYIPPIK